MGPPCRKALHGSKVCLAEAFGNLSCQLQLNENKKIKLKDLQALPWDFSSDEI